MTNVPPPGEERGRALDVLIARLAEPSTWAGFAAACGAAAAVAPDPYKVPLVVVAAFCGAWSAYRPEGRS